MSGCKKTVIPNTVTSIGGSAFYGCTGLTSIIIPNSVKSIGSLSFRGCTGLTTINIPSSVTSIGSATFSGCSHLDSVIVNFPIPLSIYNDTFDEYSKMATLYVPQGCKAVYEAAEYWKDFKEIIEMDGIIDFADAGVKSICVNNWDTNGDGELSYKEAAAVTDLNMRFYYDHEIESFNELKYFTGLKNIRSSEFRHCVKLSHIELPENIVSIGSFAFHNAPLYEMTIPDSVKIIGDWAFQSCRNLSTLYIPKNVEEIGSCITSDTPLLESIFVDEENQNYDSRDNCNAIIHTATNTFVLACKNSVVPNSVTTIGKNAFCWCKGIETIYIPKSVTTIEEQGLYGCIDLASIKIPNSVKSIGEKAFMNCDSLKSVAIGIDVPLSISEKVFTNRAKAFLYVPYGGKEAYNAADYWKEFKHIYEAGDVNRDDEIDVADVVGIARGIVGMQDDGYVEFLADFNADDEVDVRDAVALVTEIAGDVSFAKGANVGGQVASGHAVPTLSAHFADGTVSLLVGNASAYTAFQFDIHVDDGVDVESVMLNERRGNGHTLLFNKMGEGWYRVAVVSVANNPLRGTDGELVNFTLSDRYSDDIVIDNIRFVTVQGDSHQLDGIDVAELTGVQSFAQDGGAHEADDDAAYTLNGIRVKTTGKGIYVKNGKKIVVK